MLEPATHIEGYIRTVEAGPELAEPRLGLSLSQRKLLTLVEATRSVADLAATLHSDEPRVRRDLARLIELQLVRSIDAVPRTRAPDPPRLAQALPNVRMAPAVRLRGLGIGVVAIVAMAAAGVITWALLDRGPPQNVATTELPQAPAQPIAAMAASDASAGSRVPAAPADGATSTAPVVASERALRIPAPHAEPKRTSTMPEPARVALSQATTASEAPRTPQPARTTGAVGISAPTPATRAPASQASAPASARPSDEKAVSASERPVAAPVLPATPAEPAPATPANPVAHPPVETQAPTMVATAPATTLPPVVKPKLAPIAREEPEFPREAVRANVTSGRVRARLTIDKDGRVTNVEIVAAEPRRVFDRAVDSALSRWRFEPSSETRMTEVEVDFKAN
jgi:TonB family protein